MLRVLHSVSYMHRAGVETFIMNYYRHINRNAVQFDFLCNKREAGDYDKEIKKLGGRIFYRPGFDLLKEEKYVEFWNDFLKNHPEISIIHTHNGAKQYYPLQGAKIAGFPVRIAHAHSSDIIHDDKYKYRHNIIEHIPEAATHYFGCSSAAGKFFFGDKTWKEYGVLIHNAVPCSQFAWDPVERKNVRSQLGLGNCFVVGHVGRFMPQKNHMRLLDIFKHIHDNKASARLLLVGTGEMENVIKEKVKQMELDSFVIFAGNQSEMFRWYQAMDVFVLPSLFEGLPVAGIEAQASGLPCVFSDAITTEAAITPNVLFLSLNISDTVWAKAIDSFEGYKRYNTKEKIRMAGYDVEVEVKKLEKIYMDLIHQ